MAANDIGRVTPIWRGFYSAAATYELNDIVIDTAGSVWWHKSEELTTGVIPEVGEIWDAVIDMSIFSDLIQAAITTAQTALEAAQAAVAEVTADTERAETAADNAENSAAAASESAAGVGALAQAAERSAEAAAGSATGAAGSAAAAAGSKSDAEAYAVGTRGGEDVETTDPTYHNNAKYYAEQAASEAEAAAQSAEDAQDVLDSIPEDYSELSADVGDLKTQLNDLDETVNGIVTRNFIVGKILNDDGTLSDDDTCCVSEKIPYTWTGSTRYYCNDNTSTKYAICFYDSSDTLLKKVQVPSSSGGIEYRAYNAEGNIEGTVAYVRSSFKRGTTGAVRKNVSPDFELIWSAVTTISGGLVSEVSEMQNDIDGMQDDIETILKNPDPDLNPRTYSAQSATLGNGDVISTANGIDNKKNDVITFKACFTTGNFNAVAISHAHNVANTERIEIDNTNVSIYRNNASDPYYIAAHGLTLTDYISATIKHTDTGRADFSMTTNGGTFSIAAAHVPWAGCEGSVFAKSIGSTLVNASISCTFNDMRRNIFYSGDSYTSYNNRARWPYHATADGFTDYAVFGFSGARSEDQITVFRELISNNVNPKYWVWALGMNNSDSGAVNADWKSCVDEFISTCEDNGIVPILCTIPCVPTRDNTYKNQYVKDSGKRYIDFAKAVNGEAAGATWYTGMLEPLNPPSVNERVHPTEQGAIALWAQIEIDCPEMMGT